MNEEKARRVIGEAYAANWKEYLRTKGDLQRLAAQAAVVQGKPFIATADCLVLFTGMKKAVADAVMDPARASEPLTFYGRQLEKIVKAYTSRV